MCRRLGGTKCGTVGAGDYNFLWKKETKLFRKWNVGVWTGLSWLRI
jgi:hypothetical protein